MSHDRRKPYGSGFDELPHLANYKAFLDWWNGESWFALDEDELELAPVLPQAA